MQRSTAYHLQPGYIIYKYMWWSVACSCQMLGFAFQWKALSVRSCSLSHAYRSRGMGTKLTATWRARHLRSSTAEPIRSALQTVPQGMKWVPAAVLRDPGGPFHHTMIAPADPISKDAGIAIALRHPLLFLFAGVFCLLPVVHKFVPGSLWTAFWVMPKWITGLHKFNNFFLQGDPKLPTGVT